MKTKIAIILLTTSFIFNSCKKDVVSNNNCGYTWIIDSISNVLNCKVVYSITIDNKGNKWFRTKAGLSKFDGKRWTNYCIANTIDFKLIHTPTIVSDAQDNIWFSTVIDISDSSGLDIFRVAGRIIKFDGTNLTIYNDSNDLVNVITIDSNGNKWFGTAGRGLAMFDNKNWMQYKNPYDFFYNDITAIAIDSQGDKWVGTTGGGILTFDGTNWIKLKDMINVGSYSINAIAIDSKQNKWFGTNNGVLKFDGTNFTSYDTTNCGLVNDYVLSIAIDAQGNKWFGTFGGGVSKFDGTNWTSFTKKNGLTCDTVYCITIDAGGNKWIGTNSGVSELKD